MSVSVTRTVSELETAYLQQIFSMALSSAHKSKSYAEKYNFALKLP